MDWIGRWLAEPDIEGSNLIVFHFEGKNPPRAIFLNEYKGLFQMLN